MIRRFQRIQSEFGTKALLKTLLLLSVTFTTVLIFNFQFWSLSDPDVYNIDPMPTVHPGANENPPNNREDAR